MADAIRVSPLQNPNVCMRKESALSILMSFLFSCMDGFAGIMNCLGHEGSANIGILFPANNTSVRCPKAKHLYTIALLLQPGSVFSAEFGIYILTGMETIGFASSIYGGNAMVHHRSCKQGYRRI